MNASQIKNKIAGSISKNRIELLLFVLTIFIFLAFGAMKFPILKDHGLYSLVAQDAFNGKPIYSTPDIKGPFLYMADALCMSAFSFLPNWMAIRAGMLILAGLTTALFYRLVTRMLNRTTALFASLVLMSFAFFAEYFVLGDPKCIVLFLLMLGFNALFSGKNFLAGACFTLCPFTWQPSFLFMAGPLAYYYLEGFDRKKLVSFAAGAALAASAIIGYFILTNSLPNLIEFALVLPLQYKSTVYFSGTVLALFNIIACYNVEIVFIAAAILGAIYYAKKTVVRIFHGGMPYVRSKKTLFAFIIPFILFTLYISADMQIADDFIIHLSLIALINGLLLTRAYSIISGKLAPNKSRIALILIVALVAAYGFFPALQPVYPENQIMNYARSLRSEVPASEIPSLIVSKYGLADSAIYFLTIRTGEANTVDDQLALAKYINDNSDSDDKILSIAATEIMFLANKTNMNRYPLIMSEVFMMYLTDTGEMQQIRDDIIREKPKFIIFEEPEMLEAIGIDDFVYSNYNKNESVTIKNFYETD